MQRKPLLYIVALNTHTVAEKIIAATLPHEVGINFAYEIQTIRVYSKHNYILASG